MVPRADRQVSTAPLPGARRSAAENDISAGVGLADQRSRTDLAAAGVGNTVAGVGLQLTQQQREEADRARERADSVAVMNAGNVMAEWENKRLLDEGGALRVKGKDAFGLPEKVGAEFQQVAGQLEATMNTPRQKEAFARLKLERQANIDLTLRRHVAGEMQRYEGQELQAFVENGRNAAIANAGDPRRVGLELGRVTDAIRTHAKNLGLGPEEIQQQVEAATSSTHTGVIENLLAQDRSKAASVYFDETKSQIKGEALAHIEKALEEGKNRGEAQKASDKIISAGGTLTAQLEEARKIDDPKLRDEVTARIEHNATVKDRAEREQEAATLRGVYNKLDETHDVAKIPPAVWATMDGGQRSAARSYAEHLARGVGVETDMPTWVSLMQKASHDPASFATENLLNYRAKLGDTELKQLVEMQGAIVKGDRTAANRQSGNFLTHEQIINKSLTLYGLDAAAKPNTPQGKANAELFRLTMQDVKVLESKLKPGQHADDIDIQKIVDHILSTSEKVPGSWWGLVPFTSTTLRAKDVPIINLTIADVPSAQRKIIETELRSSGRAVSDATILEAYQAMRVRPR